MIKITSQVLDRYNIYKKMIKSAHTRR